VIAIVPVSLDRGATRGEMVPVEIEGREVWLSMTGYGFPGGTVYAFRDVTDERRLEEWQSEFIATISHEIRTPMASIYGAAQTLRRSDVDIGDETRESLLDVIYDEADRLARLVENILVTTRLQAERLEFLQSAVDAVDVAESVIRSLAGHAPEGVTLELDRPAAPPLVVADADKLRHVLRNLVENAIKYSPEGSRIVVRLIPQERHLRIAVQDEGLGIPPHERAQIFERFYRVGAHARRGIAGTGLGLYISRELVRRMHGRIWVTSEEGEGSTFYIELPLVDPQEVAA
jgi:signal transduction histidine kinase